MLLVCVLLRAQQPAQQEIGELYASDASVHGSVILAAGGMKVLSGASVAAGNETALLRLDRGGNVRFCPRTSASVASAPSGGNLMLGMNTGQLEVNYSLAVSANTDALVTPDFRLLLQGPGDFHFAIGADNRGNTCVRALKGNTGSVIVTELMGDTSYQVRPQEEVLFRQGRLSERHRAQPSDCGCPEPSPVLRAENVAPPPPPPQVAPAAQAPVAIPDLPAQPPASQTMAAVNSPAPPPEIHLQMDAPFVYNAMEQESPAELVTQLRLAPVPNYRRGEVLPPPASAPDSDAVAGREAAAGKPHKRSILRRVGSFFASILH